MAYLKTLCFEDLCSQVKEYTGGAGVTITPDGIISADIGLKMEILNELPQIGDSDVLYLIKNKSEQDQNIYDEYVYVHDKWELIGSTKIDLTNYYTKSETAALVDTSKLKYTIDGSNESTIQGNVTNNIASGYCSHAEGTNTTASGAACHAEGNQTVASSDFSHAEGSETTASGDCSHAEGNNTLAAGVNSHAQGFGTVAYNYQFAFGRFNEVDDTDKYSEIVGNGLRDDSRSNARTLQWNGKEWLADTLEVSRDPVADMEVATKQYVDNSHSQVVITGEAIYPTMGNLTDNYTVPINLDKGLYIISACLKFYALTDKPFKPELYIYPFNMPVSEPACCAWPTDNYKVMHPSCVPAMQICGFALLNEPSNIHIMARFIDYNGDIDFSTEFSDVRIAYTVVKL